MEITTTVENANGRIFNIQDDSNTFTEMKIEACDILDGQVLFRVKHGEGKPSLGILTISNCIVGNFTKDGSLLNLTEDKSGTLTNINIKNSTIFNMAGNVIRSKIVPVHLILKDVLFMKLRIVMVRRLQMMRN